MSLGRPTIEFYPDGDIFARLGLILETINVVVRDLPGSCARTKIIEDLATVLHGTVERAEANKRFIDSTLTQAQGNMGPLSGFQQGQVGQNLYPFGRKPEQT